MLNRSEAQDILYEWTKSESLRRHALFVESAMRAYAVKYGEDEEAWGICGLLHDFDYERYPEAPDHPIKGSEYLKKRGLPEDIIKAILGHASYTGVPRESKMAKALFAVDELCGFLTAVSYVMPSKAMKDVSVKSVKKKLKDKAFARSVNRDDIYNGAAELEVDLDEHIIFLISTLTKLEEGQ